METLASGNVTTTGRKELQHSEGYEMYPSRYTGLYGTPTVFAENAVS